ncbi:HTH_Tnp_Tc3_2 domain-containing protein [Trichonephila clavipes]|nr:HTH_Tnp_Tc3_2 domain-containing protein [Trichonephila clavipes]
MAQKKHLDDFYVVELLDDGNVDVPSWKYPRESPRVSSPCFGNDSKMMVIIRPVSSATGTTVSSQTVYRRLGHTGQYARRTVICVLLTATHCRLRLTWSILDTTTGALSQGTRYHQENTVEQHRYGGAGWLVGEELFLVPDSDLHVQSVTMTGHIY